MASTVDDDEPSGGRPHTEQTPLLNGAHTTTKHSSGVIPNHDGAAEAGPATPSSSSGADSEASTLVKEPSFAWTLQIMLVLWFGTFLAAVDATIVATLSAPISSAFNSLTLFAWVASAYIIASAAVLPLVGKLTDIFGRQQGLLVCNTLFATGNLICGLAKSEGAMITGRVVAGLGGGGLNAISTFVASDLIPLRRRGIWQGFGNVSFGLGSALGGVIGGWIHDAIGWRWAFLILVPFTVVSGAAVFFTVKIPVKEADGRSKIQRVDFAGAFTLVSSLVLLLVGLNAGGNTVPWDHPLVLISLPVAAALFALFVYIESYRALEPIIPVGLMRRPTVAAACLTNWFATMAYYSLLFYGPVYFQVRGLSATQAGLRLISSAAGIGLGSITTGVIMRLTGTYWWLNLVVETLFVAGFALCSTFDLATPMWTPFLYIFIGGFGYAGMLTTTLLALIAGVDHAFQAVVTSASYAFRSTGSVVGITLASVVFQNVLKASLWRRLGGWEGAEDVIRDLRDNLEYVKTLPEEWRVEAVGAYMDALHMVFVTSLCLSFTAGLVSLFMREHKLHTDIGRRGSSAE